MSAVGSFFRGLGKVVKWLLILGALLIVIVIIVALVGLGEAVEESEESAEQVGPAKYAQITNGMSQDEVKDILGDPENRDTRELKGIGHSDCWYYGVLAEVTTQICFDDDDEVNFKAQYGTKTK